MKIITARIALLEAVINAFTKFNATVDKVQAAVGTAVDKAQSKATAALNARLEVLANEYQAKAFEARRRPFVEAGKVQEQMDVIRAEFLERSTELNKQYATLTNQEALAKAAAEADAITKARHNLIARKR